MIEPSTQATLTLLKFEQKEKERVSKIGDGDGNGFPPDMNERIGKLEGELGGVKHGQNMLLGGLAIIVALMTLLGAFVVGFGVYDLQRADQTNDQLTRVGERVNELPAKISTDLRDLTKTVSESITAAKNQPPQVILMQVPAAQTEKGQPPTIAPMPFNNSK